MAALWCPCGQCGALWEHRSLWGWLSIRDSSLEKVTSSLCCQERIGNVSFGKEGGSDGAKRQESPVWGHQEAIMLSLLVSYEGPTLDKGASNKRVIVPQFSLYVPFLPPRFLSLLSHLPYQTHCFLSEPYLSKILFPNASVSNKTTNLSPPNTRRAQCPRNRSIRRGSASSHPLPP